VAEELRLLLNEAWAKFLRQYRFFIGVSLDGPEEDHNCNHYSANRVEDYCDFLCILVDVWYNSGQPVASIRLYGAAF
jgi:hypothetical protein